MYQLELARRGVGLFKIRGMYVYGGMVVIWWVARLLRRFGTTFEGIS